EFAARDKIPAGGSKGARRPPQCRGKSRGRWQFFPGNRICRHRREKNISTWRVKTSRESVKDGNSARCLGCVCVLLMAAPCVVGHGARMPNHVGGLFQLTTGDPASLLDHARRISPAQCREEFEYWTTQHLAVPGIDAIFTLECNISTSDFV